MTSLDSWVKQQMGRRFKGEGKRDLSVKNSICTWMQRQRKAMAQVPSKDRE
jgi:hypothetical protein